MSTWTAGRRGRQWTAKSGSLSVEVHAHMDFPGVLFVSCYALGIDRKRLAATDGEEARAEALDVVRSHVQSLADSVAFLPLDGSMIE